MNWSETEPTAPGLYWVLPPGWRTPDPYWLSELDGRTWWDAFGSDTGDSTFEPGTLYCGPLVPPPAPEA